MAKPFYRSDTITVTAGHVTVAGSRVGGAGGTDDVRYAIADITRVGLSPMSELSPPVVRWLLNVTFGIGAVVLIFSAIGYLEPQFNAEFLARFHLDLSSFLLSAAAFTLAIYGAIHFNERIKAVTITLSSGVRVELLWAANDAVLAEAGRLKDAIVRAHNQHADRQQER